jgi:hypothetical protein
MRRDLPAGSARTFASLDRANQAAYLRVRASEYRQRATVADSASRRELLNLATRFEELAVATQCTSA